MQTFSLSAQFARESAMLKLPEERRRWGESKGAGRGPRPRTYRKGYYFYSPQSSTVIKSKMAATTILRTRTRFRPTKIRLHCRLCRNIFRFYSNQLSYHVIPLNETSSFFQFYSLTQLFLLKARLPYDRYDRCDRCDR